MKLTPIAAVLAVTGAMASAAVFAQGSQQMQNQGMQNESAPSEGAQDQNKSMSGGAQSQKEAPWANQQASLDAVRKLQQALNEKGYNAGKDDGLIGPKTEAALRDFQQSQNLEANGKIDAQTLTALGIDSSEFAAFGIKEGESGQKGAEKMDQGGSEMQNGGNARPSDMPNSESR